MAHQVQFIQLSQDEYDNLSTKKEGSLYFTTDTHRIYKGETLYASTTFDQLKFDDLSATSIKVDGVDVSLEGHTHTKGDIDDFPENVSDFTNDVGYLTEDDIQDINFENLNATSLKVDNKNVSLEGHTHTKSEIDDFPTNVSSFTNDVGYLKSSELDLSGYMPITGANLTSDWVIQSDGRTVTWNSEFGYMRYDGADNGLAFGIGTFNEFETGSYILFHDWDQVKMGDYNSSQTLEQFIKSLITSTAHTHTKSQITDFAHTHTKSDITDFPTDVSSFTNDVGYLTETDLQDIEFGELEAESLKVDGKDVSVEGHTHTKSDIEDFPTNVSSFTNDAGYITQSDVDLTSITEKIPAAASSTNQLADKKFVTDSISTNSATFRGTFDSVSKLPTSGIDNNDYAIVKTETDINNQTYTRYKYDGSKWVEEFTLNNTPFNSEQWAAINSGITSTTLDDYVKTSDLENVNFENLKATSLTVDGKQVSLEDHTHSKDDITDFPTNVGDFENDIGYITIDDVDLSECSKVGHTHSVDEIEGWDDTDLKFTNLNAESLKVDGKNVSLEGHTHKVDELDGWRDAEIEFGSIEAEQIKVNDKDVSLEGHKHTTSDIEGLENIKTGAEFQLKIPSQSVDKTIDKLVVNKLTQSEYDSLKSNGTLSDEELYFVDSNVLDAGGNTIPNVSTPVNVNDAATKGYVDTQVGQVRQDVSSIEPRVQGIIKTYVDERLENEFIHTDHKHDKVYDETLDESYISGNCDYYQNTEDRQNIDILVCDGYKFKSNDYYEYRCINGDPGYYLRIEQYYDEYWENWCDGDFYFYNGYYADVVQLENGKWGAQAEIYQGGDWDITFTVYSNEQFDNEYEAWDCWSWTYSIERDGVTGTGYQNKNIYDEMYAYVYDEMTNDSISDTSYYPDLYGEFTMYSYDGSGREWHFVHDVGPYGDPIPGTKGWKKTDTIVKTSDLEKAVAEKIPTKVSQLQNDTGFVTSSHSHSTSQISGLSTYLTQINTNKTNITNLTTQVNTNKTDITTLKTNTTGLTKTGITKTTGTITTLNSTTLTAGTVNATNINLTGTFNVDDMEVADLTATNMNVTVGLKISGKPVATQEYVESKIPTQTIVMSGEYEDGSTFSFEVYVKGA